MSFPISSEPNPPSGSPFPNGFIGLKRLGGFRYGNMVIDNRRRRISIMC